MDRTAETISIGGAILAGHVADTTPRLVAAALARAGIEYRRHTMVGDAGKELVASLRRACDRADLVLTRGGLGPAREDRTREAIAAAWGVKLHFRPVLWTEVAARLGELGREPTADDARQAELPATATALSNPVGAAPGLLLTRGAKAAICLPGPADEFQALLLRAVEPWLVAWSPSAAPVVSSRFVRVGGLERSAVELRLAGMAARNAVSYTTYTGCGEVLVRLTVRADSRAKAAALLDQVEADARRRLEPWAFGSEERGIEHAVGDILRARGLTLAVAESCTGGLLAGRITAVPGASDYFLLGVTPYDNRFKLAVVGVNPQDLAASGAVSGVVARELAEGVRRLGQADIGLGITGVAGPGGGTAAKPVGTVWAALAAREGTWARCDRWPGDRGAVRTRAVQEVLLRLWMYLMGGGAAFEGASVR